MEILAEIYDIPISEVDDMIRQRVPLAAGILDIKITFHVMGG